MYWHISATPELLGITARKFESFSGAMAYENKSDIQGLIQKYFLQWLMAQRNVSPETINSYRDAFRLYFKYIVKKLGIISSKISFKLIINIYPSLSRISATFSEVSSETRIPVVYISPIANDTMLARILSGE